MPKLIKDNQLINDDPWQAIESSEEFQSSDYPLAPLSLLTDESFNSNLNKSFGIVFEEQDNFDLLFPLAEKASIIVFRFGKFADGRAFSYARALRQQHNYKGDIRADGDFLPDQVDFLQRCGFSSLSCRNADEASTAIALKDTFSVAYQADTLESAPLFRRR